MNLKGKVVLILGGAGLLGRALVESIAAEGASVVLGDRDEKESRKALSAIRERRPSSEILEQTVDITSRTSLDDSFGAVAKKHGRIDAIINTAYPRNARYGMKFEDIDYSDFCENVNLHLGGYFLASQRTALFSKKQGFGNIVNIASVYGVIPPRFGVYEGTSISMPVEYAAIKSAIIHLTRYMAQYCKSWNVRVNCVSPGGILADQDAAFLQKYKSYCAKKGMLDPGDIAGTVTFLLSDHSQYITGQNIVVDDGFSL